MNTVRLYKWLVPRMFDTPAVNWSLNDYCFADWSELLEEKEFIIPEGYHVSEDMCGTKHFYKDGTTYPYFDIHTSQKSEIPYIDTYPDYLILAEKK